MKKLLFGEKLGHDSADSWHVVSMWQFDYFLTQECETEIRKTVFPTDPPHVVFWILYLLSYMFI